MALHRRGEHSADRLNGSALRTVLRPGAGLEEDAERECAAADDRDAAAEPVGQEHVGHRSTSIAELPGERRERTDLVVTSVDGRLANTTAPAMATRRPGRPKIPSHSISTIIALTEAKIAVWIAFTATNAAGADGVVRPRRAAW